MPEPGRDVILVVDDSPETLSFLTSAIEATGATVLVAVSGEAALTLVQEITPDIILLDAVMPGLDGFETCRRLKANAALAHVPVIFMTGLSETEHIVRGLEAGGVDYVAKPISATEILARIRVHLANARAAQSARLALDSAGRYLFAVDGAGSVRWCTPQAARLLRDLAESSAAGDPALPPAARAWLRAAAPGPVALATPDGRRLQLSRIGQVGGDEILLRLALDGGGEIERLRRALGLTQREAEVLLWVSRGKASRDIGEILSLSPRTVTKHLEQVYAKLGVENRTSASALVVRALQEQGG
ncbi:two component transcriptional regulator, LuxR family [Methylobacterium sp. 4-46]|uniref:response regulator transcription factor n=1 Tax=unclassified Methylobacterium TaxID=2615210 RepID=UPI000152CB61|nr:MULTISPECIES: response regulator transcription factor [Methylobacterium]ACA15152.1 two component transcriptional regulator, LuxR family [Methylobacterium sp. 4-46]WFT80886.1 response regulator transcription factor [Methylobacterium nodulans]